MTDIGELKVKITADAAKLDREMKRVTKVTEDSSRKIRISIGTIGRAFLALGGALAARGIIDSIRTFEKLEASLRTVTGSAENAREAFSFIQDFATTTPFQLEEVVGAFIKLKALGLEPSRDALVAYGNTASAMGKSLNQFIEAVADAATGEFERLKEFGIKARQQGDDVSFTFKGISTTVGKNAAEIEQYLRNIGKTDFAGAMEEQAGTLNVATSNMGDSFARLGKAIGDAGVRDYLVELAEGVQGFTDDVTDSIPKIREYLDLLDSFKPSTNAKSNLPGQNGPQGFVSDTRPRTVDFAVFAGSEQFGPAQQSGRSAPQAPSSAEKKAADRIAEAKQALADYNKELRLQNELLKLSPRDAAALAAEYQTIEIAQRGGTEATQEQIAANRALARTNYDLQESIRATTRAQEFLRDRISETLTDMVFKADSASDAFRGLAESIARAAFERQVAGPLADSLVGSGGSSGLLGSLASSAGDHFGGFFANGGNPPVGKASIVGERGPEIFVPKTAGTVVPNDKIGMGGVTVYQTISLNPGATEQTVAQLRNLVPAIKNETMSAVFSAMKQGGSASKITGLRN